MSLVITKHQILSICNYKLKMQSEDKMANGQLVTLLMNFIILSKVSLMQIIRKLLESG